MKLKILLPAEMFLVEEVAKVVAEAENGFFCLLPQHIDFTASLVPGDLRFTRRETGSISRHRCGDPHEEGPRDPRIDRATPSKSDELGKLRDMVVRQFEEIDEREKKARSAAAKLEVDLLRRFMELREHE